VIQKVAAIQIASGTNVSANLAEVEKLAEEAAKAGAKLIVLPENFAFLGGRCREMLSIREEDGSGPLQDFLSQLARRLKVWLVGGTIPLEIDASLKVQAACLVFDDKGNRVARYNKMHLFDVRLPDTDESYEESDVIDPGNQVVVVDSPFGRLGLAVCYDLRFPELFRAMLDLKVEIIALPAAFTALTGKAHWDVLVRARAVENLVYMVAAAQGGFHVNSRETYGHSMIVDPWGTVLDERERNSGYVIGEVKKDFQQAIRRNFPCIDHRQLHCA